MSNMYILSTEFRAKVAAKLTPGPPPGPDTVDGMTDAVPDQPGPHATDEATEEPPAPTPRRVFATVAELDGNREALAAFRDAILGK